MAMIRTAEDFTLQDDFANALQWYEKAADAGSVDAVTIAGDIFHIGEDGTEQSYIKAFERYSRAAQIDKGNMAKIKRPLMIYRGLGVRRHLASAFKQFEYKWSKPARGVEKTFARRRRYLQA